MRFDGLASVRLKLIRDRMNNRVTIRLHGAGGVERFKQSILGVGFQSRLGPELDRLSALGLNTDAELQAWQRLLDMYEARSQRCFAMAQSQR